MDSFVVHDRMKKWQVANSCQMIYCGLHLPDQAVRDITHLIEVAIGNINIVHIDQTTSRAYN
jgi:hypothetical protein